MSIGARAHDFGKRDAAALAAAVREGGFDSVQLALPKAIAGIDSVEGVRPAQLEEIREAFGAAGVAIPVLGCYVEPALPDRAARLEQVARFCTGLAHAKALGTPVAATETTHLPPGAPGREAAYGNLLDSVLRMAEAAEKYGVDFALEPVALHTLHTAELAERLAGEVGSARLRFVLDPVNLLLSGEEDQPALYGDFVRRLGGRICALHMKDVVFEYGEAQWRNIGEGVVDYAALFALLGDAAALPLLREHVRPGSARQDAAAMRRLAGR